jgi:hypothetical protein
MMHEPAKESVGENGFDCSTGSQRKIFKRDFLFHWLTEASSADLSYLSLMVLLDRLARLKLLPLRQPAIV